MRSPPLAPILLAVMTTTTPRADRRADLRNGKRRLTDMLANAKVENKNKPANVEVPLAGSRTSLDRNSLVPRWTLTCKVRSLPQRKTPARGPWLPERSIAWWLSRTHVRSVPAEALVGDVERRERS